MALEAVEIFPFVQNLMLYTLLKGTILVLKGLPKGAIHVKVNLSRI